REFMRGRSDESQLFVVLRSVEERHSMAYTTQVSRDISSALVGPSVQRFAPGTAWVCRILFVEQRDDPTPAAAAARRWYDAGHGSQPAKRCKHCLHGHAND